MDLDTARRFLVANHRAVMVTHRAGGPPQLSPVTVGVGPDGRARVSTRETAAKTKNLERDQAVSLCVMTDAFFGAWIQIDGRAEIVHLPEAMEGLVDYYRSISGEHPNWDEYRQAMTDQRRVLLEITIEHAGPDHHG